MHSSAKSLTAVFTCFALVSCQPGCEIHVSGSPKAVVIELTDGMLFHFGPPPISNLYVQSANSDRPIWEIHASDGCRPIRKVIYGQAPSGFNADQGPAPLQMGKIYQVSVFGCGRPGGAWFRVDGDKVKEIPNPNTE